MYIPPMAPVNKPDDEPAKVPLMNMASWVKWILDAKGPITKSIVKKSKERIFARAAITAAKAKTFVRFVSLT